MRILLVPMLTSVTTNINSDSDFRSCRTLIHSFYKAGIKAFFYFLLPKRSDGHVDAWPGNNYKILYMDESTGYSIYEQAVSPLEVYKMFDTVYGQYQIDCVLSERTFMNASIKRAFLDRCGREIPVFTLESKTLALSPSENHNSVFENDLRSRVFGYASSYNMLATKSEYDYALEAMRKYFSPFIVREFMKNSDIVPFDVDTDEIDTAIKDVKKSDKFTLFWTGRMNTNKNWDKAADLFDKFFCIGNNVQILINSPLNGAENLDKKISHTEIKYTGGNLSRSEYLKTLCSSNIGVSFSDIEGFCYDEKTEIMTDNGWKFFKDLSEKDMVLQNNNGAGEFVKPSLIYKNSYNGDMYLFDKRNCSFCVTPKHSMFYTSDIKRAKFRLDKIEKAVEMIQFRMTGRFEWNGNEQEVFVLPKRIGSRYGPKIHALKKSREFQMDIWLEFLGWFIAEGCVCGKGVYGGVKGNDRYVEIVQKKGESLDRIIDLSKSFGWHIYLREGSRECVKVRIYSVQLAEWLKRECFVEDDGSIGKFKKRWSRLKKIPDFIKKLSSRQIKIFMDAYWEGDGTIDDPRSKSKQRRFDTWSNQLADDIQELSLKTGNLPIRRKQGKEGGFQVYEKTGAYSIDTKSIKIVKYVGNIYCVEVPSHIVLVRRKGFPYWCGNSVGLIEQVYSGMVVLMPSKKRWARALFGEAEKDYKFFYDDFVHAYALLKEIYLNYEEATKKMLPVRDFIRKNYRDIDVSIKRYGIMKRRCEEFYKEAQHTISNSWKDLIRESAAEIGNSFDFSVLIDKIKSKAEFPELVGKKAHKIIYVGMNEIYRYMGEIGYKDRCDNEVPIFEKMEG